MGRVITRRPGTVEERQAIVRISATHQAVDYLLSRPGQWPVAVSEARVVSLEKRLGMIDQNPPEGTLVELTLPVEGRQTAGQHTLCLSGFRRPMVNWLRPFLCRNCWSNHTNGMTVVSSIGLRANCAVTDQDTVQARDFNGRKACGLLIENHLSGLNVETTVLGVGINVNQSSFGAELANRATSIAREGGVPVDLQPLFGQVLRSLEQWMAQLRQRHDAAVRAAIDRAYLSRLYRYQEWAPFADEAQTFQGMIVGVTQEGKLAVQTPARDVRYYGFKEVSFE